MDEEAHQLTRQPRFSYPPTLPPSFLPYQAWMPYAHNLDVPQPPAAKVPRTEEPLRQPASPGPTTTPLTSDPGFKPDVSKSASVAALPGFAFMREMPPPDTAMSESDLMTNSSASTYMPLLPVPRPPSVRPGPDISVSENALKALHSHQQDNALLQANRKAQILTSETLGTTLSPAIISTLSKVKDIINKN